MDKGYQRGRETGLGKIGKEIRVDTHVHTHMCTRPKRDRETGLGNIEKEIGEDVHSDPHVHTPITHANATHSRLTHHREGEEKVIKRLRKRKKGRKRKIEAMRDFFIKDIKKEKWINRNRQKDEERKERRAKGEKKKKKRDKSK